MAIEAPARIAVLGAGPIGLEAALYARFLGYEVDLYERGAVAENVRQLHHVRLFSPFGVNASPLALAALEAQDGEYHPPDADALLTGQEYVARFLLPLSQTDLLAEGLKEQTEVLAISRGGLLKGDLVGSEDREDPEFRLLVRDAQGRERIETADVVIDATGTYGNHNWAGAGGIPAIGERELERSIEYGLPDVLGRHRDIYCGRHTLVIGSGYSAATTIVALAELARQDPGTRATWITRGSTGPIAEIPQDRLKERQRIALRANELAAAAGPNIEYRPGTLLEAVAWDESTQRFRVMFGAEETREFDQIVANVGYRPDTRLWSELQVHECYASGGPMKLAAALMGNASGGLPGSTL